MHYAVAMTQEAWEHRTQLLEALLRASRQGGVKKVPLQLRVAQDRKERIAKYADDQHITVTALLVVGAELVMQLWPVETAGTDDTQE